MRLFFRALFIAVSGGVHYRSMLISLLIKGSLCKNLRSGWSCCCGCVGVIVVDGDEGCVLEVFW